MFELIFEVIFGKFYEALLRLGLPPWAAVTLMLIVFGSLIGAAIYFSWGW